MQRLHFFLMQVAEAFEGGEEIMQAILAESSLSVIFKQLAHILLVRSMVVGKQGLQSAGFSLGFSAAVCGWGSYFRLAERAGCIAFQAETVFLCCVGDRVILTMRAGKVPAWI